MAAVLEVPTTASSSSAAVRTEALLSAIDGLVFGVDPRHGYRIGNRLIRPRLAVEITFPSEYEVSLARDVVYAYLPETTAFVRLSASKTSEVAEPETYAREFFRRHRLASATGERVRIGPFAGYRAPFRAQTRSASLLGEAGFFVDGETVHVILAMADEKVFARHLPFFHRAIRSLNRVRERGALEPEPLTIALHSAPRAQRLSEVLASAGVEAERFELLARLNDRALDSQLEKGALVKILEPRSP
jgi:predicted Zn-dependent protease